jgi:hypothetical protein
MITDITPYKEHLDEFDLTEQEKLELVNVIYVVSQHLLEKQFGLKSRNTWSMGEHFEDIMWQLKHMTPKRTTNRKRK